MLGYSGDALRPAADALFFPVAYFHRHAAFRWLLRRAFRRQQLDWPTRRRARGQASSLYLFSYYLGSSLAGTLGGVFWHHYGWNGVGGFIALLLLAALLTGTCLHQRLK